MSELIAGLIGVSIGATLAVLVLLWLDRSVGPRF